MLLRRRGLSRRQARRPAVGVPLVDGVGGVAPYGGARLARTRSGRRGGRGAGRRCTWRRRTGTWSWCGCWWPWARTCRPRRCPPRPAPRPARPAPARPCCLDRESGLAAARDLCARQRLRTPAPPHASASARQRLRTPAPPPASISAKPRATRLGGRARRGAAAARTLRGGLLPAAGSTASRCGRGGRGPAARPSSDGPHCSGRRGARPGLVGGAGGARGRAAL